MMKTKIDRLYKLTEANQHRAADPQTSAWVSASAGSGKTKVLTDRVLNLLLSGVSPQRVLCLTFTKAAAAEMAQRINSELGSWAVSNSNDLESKLMVLTQGSVNSSQMNLARRLLAQVLEVPDGMKIMTIHAFCQSVLSRFPIEAGVLPNFSVMDERDTNDLLEHVRLDLIVNSQLIDSELTFAVANLTSSFHETQFPELMTELTKSRSRVGDLIDKHGGVKPLIEAVYKTLNLSENEDKNKILKKACEDVSFNFEGLNSCIKYFHHGSKIDKRNAEIIKKWLHNPQQRIDFFDEYLSCFFTKNETIRNTLITKRIIEKHPKSEIFMAEEARRLHEIKQKIKSVNIAEITSSIIHLANGIMETYTSHKSSRALLDYDDLIIRTRQLLEAQGTAAWVLYKLDGGIDHILIDEAQDTNSDQWRIIASIANEFYDGIGSEAEKLNSQGLPSRSIFAVGDVKQSIFSFQGAEPEEFGVRRKHFSKKASNSQNLWEDVSLDVSFRSTEPILKVVDSVFSKTPASIGVVKTEEVLEHLPIRFGDGGCVEIWPPLKNKGPSAPQSWKPPIERVSSIGVEERLAGLIARRISSWIETGEILESYNRPIEPSDIMVLVRRRTPFVDSLVRSLKDLSIPVAGVDRMLLTDQLVVMDLLALGEFLLLPEDDLNLATVLKCPLIGFNDEDLYKLAYKRPGTIWDSLREQSSKIKKYDTAYKYLLKLLNSVDFLKPYELYAQLLNQDGRALILSRLGPESADPLNEFLSLALAYEKNNAPSLQGFLKWVTSSQTEIKRDLDQATGAVRVMTVHGAKGLQAPIVILPDTMQTPKKISQLLWYKDILLYASKKSDRDETTSRAYENAKNIQSEEYRRLLYVAMTRAADRLYICGWETKNSPPKDCWYNLINDPMKGIAESTKCEFLTNDSEDLNGAVLRLESVQTQEPNIENKIIHKFSTSPPPNWAIELPPKETKILTRISPSESKQNYQTQSLIENVNDKNRFHRGNIIHHLMQWLPTLPLETRQKAARKYLSKSYFQIPTEIINKILIQTQKILQDENLSDLFSSTGIAEVPISGVVSGSDGLKRVISGQIDRLLILKRSITVVDYKTDWNPPKLPKAVDPAYLRQMSAYQTLLKDAYPDRTISCYLLWTETPHLMEIPHKLLEKYSVVNIK